MRVMAWWLLPVAILLVGCPGPEDQRKLDAISDFEGFTDRLMNRIGPDLSAGCGLSLLEEGGGPGSVWSLTLIDYMVRPLVQPSGSWLGDVHFSLVRSGEECSLTRQAVEIYIEFVGDGTKWTPYSSASRVGSIDGKADDKLWRLWEPDSEDWEYLVWCVAAISPQQETGSDDGTVGMTPGNQEVSE